MLTNPIEIKKQENIEFEPIPEDIYECVVSDVNEIEQLKFNSKDEMEKVLNFEFIVQDEGFNGRKLWKKIRPIINSGFEGGQPSMLFILVSAIVGKGEEREITAEFLNTLIDKKVRVMVKNKEGKKGTFSVVSDFLPVKG